MSDSWRLALLRAIADVIEFSLRAMLPEPYQITVLAFRLDNLNADVLVSRSSIENVRAALTRLESTGLLTEECADSGELSL